MWSMSSSGSSSKPRPSRVSSDLAVISSPASAKISPVSGIEQVLGDDTGRKGPRPAARMNFTPRSASGARRRAVSFLPASITTSPVSASMMSTHGLDALEAVGVERQPPAVLLADVENLVVEGGEDFLAVEAEREQQRRRRNLAAAIDARIDDVLGVEFDVEPGAAIGDYAGGEQQFAGTVALALVVIEEHARRTVHLRDDDALGAVDDEGAVRSS